MFWDVPGWDGETRRSVVGAAGAPTPHVEPPEHGKYLTGYFWGIRGFLSSHDDVVRPSLVREWSEWSGVSLSRREEGIIYAMDRAFRKAMPDAIKFHDARREHKRKMEGK